VFVVLAVTVISAEPLKLVPLMFLAVCSVVAVNALPEQEPDVVAFVAFVALVTAVVPMTATTSDAVAAEKAAVPLP